MAKTFIEQAQAHREHYPGGCPHPGCDVCAYYEAHIVEHLRTRRRDLDRRWEQLLGRVIRERDDRDETLFLLWRQRLPKRFKRRKGAQFVRDLWRKLNRPAPSMRYMGDSITGIYTYVHTAVRS